MKFNIGDCLTVDNNFYGNVTSYHICNNSIILNMGCYELELIFLISKNNFSDRLSINLDNSTLMTINIPYKETNFKFKTFIKSEKNNTILSFKNNSDDFLLLNYFQGGLTMADYTIMIIENTLNDYSFDLQLSTPFTSDTKVEVYPAADPDNKISVTAVPSVINYSDNIRTISPVQSTNPNDPPNLFSRNTLYIVKVTLSSGNHLETTFTLTQFPGIIDYKLDKIGDRILTATFDYPIQNLSNTVDNTQDVDINTKIDHTSLTNFYLLYNGLDLNVSLSPENLWAGLIDLSYTKTVSGTSTTSTPFEVRVSSDLRRIEIQSNDLGFPLGSTHSLAVNYSKIQAGGKPLTDFSPNFNILPIIGKTFTVTKEQIPAKAITMEALSPYQILVTFDKPVCLRASEYNALTLNGQIIPLVTTGTKVERYANNFYQLKYNLLNALPLGKAITIGLNQITDASGYLTDATSFTIPVVATPPILVDAYQIADSAVTKIRLVYSTNMLFTGDASATNSNNYSLSSVFGLILPSQITATKFNDTTVDLSLPLLQSGTYKLIVKDVQSALGVVINPNPTSKNITIIDTTLPSIVSILVPAPISAATTAVDNTTNALVVLFNEAMQKVGDHAASNATNYKLVSNATPPNPADPYIFPNVSDGNFIKKEDKWIRLTLPSGYPNNMPLFSTNTYNLYIGYPRIQDFKYVTNASGNIYPICDYQNAFTVIPKLNIADGSLSITSDHSIEYNHPSTLITSNEFSYVDKNDFSLTDNSTATPKTIEILNATLVDYTKIIFEVAQGTFTPNSTSIQLKTRAQTSITSLDIFAKQILGDQTLTKPVNNRVPSVLKGVSLVSMRNLSAVSNAYALIALAFSSNILYTDKSDFRVYIDPNNDGTRYALPVEVVSRGTAGMPDSKNLPANVVLLKAGISEPTFTSSTAKFYVETVSQGDGINTSDINGTPIAPFTSTLVEKLFVTSTNFSYVAGTTGASPTDGRYIFTMTLNLPAKLKLPSAPILQYNSTLSSYSAITQPKGNTTSTTGSTTSTDGVNLYITNAVGNVADPLTNDEFGMFSVIYSKSFVFTVPITLASVTITGNTTAILTAVIEVNEDNMKMTKPILARFTPASFGLVTTDTNKELYIYQDAVPNASIF
jgi:hypothetical protein